jgi:hypothetical protein
VEKIKGDSAKAVVPLNAKPTNAVTAVTLAVCALISHLNEIKVKEHKPMIMTSMKFRNKAELPIALNPK